MDIKQHNVDSEQQTTHKAPMMEITSLMGSVFCADDMDTRNQNVGITRRTHKIIITVETTMKTQITHQNEKSWKICH